MIKHFYIFRHGQCPLNITGHIQGQKINGSLTNVGRTQAFLTAQNLKDKQISLIVTSPMKRAIQTAQIVAKELNCPILVDHRFIEVNMGIIEGMHISTAEKKYASTYAKWRSNTDGNTCFINGETKSEVLKRALSGLNHHLIHTPHNNIGISSHGIIISQILHHLGKKLNNIPNGAILHISYQNQFWQFNEFLT